MTGKVLIVDDDRDLREALGQTLDLAGFETTIASAFIEAKDVITRDFAGVVITDMMMPGRDGFHLLDYAASVDADLPVIVLTGQGSVPSAVKAIDRGAFAYLEKPCASEDLIAHVGKALQARKIIVQSRQLKRDSEKGDAAERLLFGISPEALALREQTRTVARTNVEVIITGDPGAGTSKIAEVIHLLSAAAHHPFVKRAGTALTVEALDEALALAGSGTLFIDEVVNLSPASQYHLLGILEGGCATRILAGNTTDLVSAVEAGTLNADLFYRLDLMRVRVPALKERPEDIPVLFRHYVAQASEQANLTPPEITPEVTARLMAQDWPGNARSLMQAAMRFAMGVEETVAKEDLGLAAQMAQIEKGLIVDALRRCQGRASETARQLRLPRKTFYDKLVKHGLRAEDFRSD